MSRANKIIKNRRMKNFSWNFIGLICAQLSDGNIFRQIIVVSVIIFPSSPESYSEKNKNMNCFHSICLVLYCLEQKKYFHCIYVDSDVLRKKTKTLCDLASFIFGKHVSVLSPILWDLNVAMKKTEKKNDEFVEWSHTFDATKNKKFFGICKMRQTKLRIISAKRRWLEENCEQIWKQ